jgi:signal transduction histidine kinase
MGLFGKSTKDVSVDAAPEQSLATINEMLYKRSAELATKNKALSLLGHLYETSIQTLKPNDLARLISESVQQALNYDLVTIFHYRKAEDSFNEIGFAISEKMSDQLKIAGYQLSNIIITNASSRSFFTQLVQERKPAVSERFGYLLKNVLPEKEIERLATQAHLVSSLVYPLVLGDKVLGAFAVSFNREYDALPDYEKEIIGSIANVISLSLEKAFVYEELKAANLKLQELDKLKTEFLSLASHQLRSPLTAIKGYTSMLLEGSFGQITDSQKEAIDRVYQSSSHLAKVVEDLLNVSKIEQGGMKYQMAAFDLEKAAKDLATDLSITAEKKGLKLEFVTDNKAPYTIYGDMEKLRQVLLNIIDNAIKYTQTGSITVSLKEAAQAGYIVLGVTDTGMGISPEEKEKLFQKFSRGEGGKTNTGGSGLGLYLAKTIVEAHKGHIAIDSPGVGKGSTFSIEFERYTG